MRALLVIAILSSSAHADPCTADEPGLEAASPPHDSFTLTKTAYKELPGWSDDKLAEAIPAFLKSCAKLAELKDDEPVGVDGHGGLAKQWRRACAAAAAVKPGDDAARAFFETEFVPYVASGKAGTTGKLTGFDVQSMRASRTKHGAFTIPVLGRPRDLVMVDLGNFVHDGHGRHLWGRLVDGELQPFFTRSEIRKGALASERLEILYADDPVDVLFAQIEGSARAKLDDGSEVWLEFAGKNGRSYLGVGGLLKQKGELKAPGSGTMQGIRQWFKDHAGRFDEIVDGDASYVFFKESKEPGAVGSQKVILTPRRSLAVDRAFIAMSTPVFVDTKAPVVGKLGVTAPWQHLLIAQDTGAGIMGAVRGDVYWGADRDAEELGGRMGGPGRYWVLLPKGVSK
ncbi:MAG TPA: MltA domain-containing protein [Kofleriaceae bacterium]|jgi:membrane-bound lytic murein transglycosylase A